MAAVSAIIGAAGLALSVYKTAQQQKQGKEMAAASQKALDEYQRQSLDNPSINLSVPTAGFEMAREEVARSSSQTAQALSQTGARGVVGGVGYLTQNTGRSMAEISAKLQDAEYRLQTMMAGEEARIQQMRERREEQDIAGIGSQWAYGKTLQQAGQQGMIQTIGSAAEYAGTLNFGNGNQTPRDTANMAQMNPSTMSYQLPDTNTLKPMNY